MIPEHTNFCTICHPVQWASAIVRPKSYCFQVTFWQLGSGQRYQILSHVFAHCASQKTHWHARFAPFSRKSVQFSHVRVVSRAILACQCVFWLAQRKSVTQLIYLRPLPTGNTHILQILVQKCRLACLAAGEPKRTARVVQALVYTPKCCGQIAAFSGLDLWLAHKLWTCLVNDIPQTVYAQSWHCWQHMWMITFFLLISN